MGLLKQLFRRKKSPGARVRICLQCGMPVGEHKEWCTILKAQQTGPPAPTEAVAPD